jgi:hypothetical protein
MLVGIDVSPGNGAYFRWKLFLKETDKLQCSGRVENVPLHPRGDELKKVLISAERLRS